MKFKLVIYSNDKVSYLIVNENELDNIYFKYKNCLVLVLNIIQ